MRIERAGRWPMVPWWAVLLVAVHVGLVGVYVFATREPGDEVPSLCMFQRLTGRPCPACGTTRMVLALGQGDLRVAVACNPLLFMCAVIGLGLLVLRVGFQRRIVWITSPASRRLFTTVLVLAVLANWIYLLAVM